MRKNTNIRDAIDESLSGVRFTNQDIRTVLSSTTRRRKASPRRFEFAFALAALVIVLVPAALFALRAQRTPITSIAAAPILSEDPKADQIVKTAAQYTAEESEAIRIARACFESVCDTSIFSFEEYAVSVAAGGDRVYSVTLESIYGNGCRFTADVSLSSGSVIRHSTPQLATVPAYLNSDSPEVAAWYDRYGPIVMAWPQGAQAEFSRRYEGGLLRAALPGEMTPEQAEALAIDALRSTLPELQDTPLFGYSMLRAERAGGDGAARYVVILYDGDVADPLSKQLGSVTFSPDGSSVEITPK